MRSRPLRLAGWLASLSLASCSSSGAPASPVDAGSTVLGDPNDVATPPRSCAFRCPIAPDCAEATTAYVCPSLAPWASIPHADTCPAWDGTYPSVTAGQCAATAPTDQAIAPAHKGGPVVVLPDGRRVAPAGVEWLFADGDVAVSLPVSLLPVPGTTFVLVVDVGYEANALHVIDTTKFAAGDPSVSHVAFTPPSLLNRGAAFVSPNHLYVATDDGHVQAMTIDLATGALARDDARNVPLPQSIDDQSKPAHYYVSGVAASPDGKRLAVSSVFDRRLLVLDVDEASATRGTVLGSADLGGTQTFGAWFDPHDANGTTVYVSSITSSTVLEVDVSNAKAPSVKRSFAVAKAPQGIAFLDARWMAVADDFGDSIDLVDRASGTVTPVPVTASDGLHGVEPSTLAFDAARSRLYATLAGANAVASWKVDLATTPPGLAPVGRLGTAWWPTDVAVMSDGSLVVADLKGHGAGPVTTPVPPDSGSGMTGAGGGVQHVTAASDADFAAGDENVRANDAVGSLPGMPVVQCPAGADDFPVPTTNTGGPSRQITHVFFVVRENKTFDTVFGDLPGVNGDPGLTAKVTTAEQDQLWPNTRALAKAFAISDNYYTDAEISVQGHYWTTYARSSDFTERTWFDQGGGYSRDAISGPVPIPGIAGYSEPLEGSMFDWLSRNHVDYDILGEGDGAPAVVPGDRPRLDLYYPGGPIQSIGYPDIEKSCYVAGRANVRCDLGAFTYMTLLNDHCNGVSPTTASPETMIATNDEATGILVDGISHGPLWASSLIVVTQDDPQQGADHVDHHRAPIVLVSPWIKRGYVSSTHADVASLAKLFAHVLGVPYPNAVVANASLPLDLFTSTPDYTPFTHVARTWPLTCGVDATRDEILATSRWDLRRADDQPGLDALVSRYMRRTSESKRPAPLPASGNVPTGQRGSTSRDYRSPAGGLQ